MASRGRWLAQELRAGFPGRWEGRPGAAAEQEEARPSPEQEAERQEEQHQGKPRAKRHAPPFREGMFLIQRSFREQSDDRYIENRVNQTARQVAAEEKHKEMSSRGTCRLSLEQCLQTWSNAHTKCGLRNACHLKKMKEQKRVVCTAGGEYLSHKPPRGRSLLLNTT